MEIYWTLKAQDDLERIYRFALQYSRQHADDVLDRLILVVLVLQHIRQLVYSRLGMNLGKSEKCYLMIMRSTTNFVTMTFISWISGIPEKNVEEIFFSFKGVD